jgi:DNA-binding transcriptional LysR family regulator
VRPAGPLRVNNGDAAMPALIAGLGIAVLPDFIVGEALARGDLQAVLDGWTLSPSALHLLLPPGGPRPARVQVLGDFLGQRLSRPGYARGSLTSKRKKKSG